MEFGPARIRYEKRKRHRQKIKSFAGVWNFLSIVFLLAIVGLGGWFGFLFINREEVDVQKQANITQPIIISTHNLIKSTTTIERDFTSPQISTPFIAEPATNLMFGLQAEPQYISADLFRKGRGCNWMGIAGQVFDLKGIPIPGITVQVSGPIYDNNIKLLSMTGAAPWYGIGGFEVFLGEKPTDTSDQFQVRLVDKNGNGLSPLIKFDTRSDCEHNLVVINFQKIQ
jgi:hypothetical protein